MPAFDGIIINFILGVVSKIIGKLWKRIKGRPVACVIIMGCIIAAFALGAKHIPLYFRWESDMMNVHPGLETEVLCYEGSSYENELDHIPDSGYFYTKISYGGVFRKGNKILSGGQLVNLPGGSKYVYKVRTVDGTDKG